MMPGCTTGENVRYGVPSKPSNRDGSPAIRGKVPTEPMCKAASLPHHYAGWLKAKSSYGRILNGGKIPFAEARDLIVSIKAALPEEPPGQPRRSVSQ